MYTDFGSKLSRVQIFLGEGLVHETVAYIADFLFELGLVFVVVVLQPETLVSFLNQFVPASLLLKIGPQISESSFTFRG